MEDLKSGQFWALLIAIQVYLYKREIWGMGA